MQDHSFYLILDLPEEYDFHAVDQQLFAAGIEGFSQTAGYPVVCWELTNTPLMQTMKTAIQQIEAAGFFVARVESEESFALKCINERLDQRRLSRHA